MKFRPGDFVYVVDYKSSRRAGGFGTVMSCDDGTYSIYPWPDPDRDGVVELQANHDDVRKAYLTHYGPVFQRRRTNELARGCNT